MALRKFELASSTRDRCSEESESIVGTGLAILISLLSISSEFSCHEFVDALLDDAQHHKHTTATKQSKRCCRSDKRKQPHPKSVSDTAD